MTRVVFRTAAAPGIGIGHLVRCAHLAREIGKLGGDCKLVLDCLPTVLDAFVEGIDVESLYPVAILPIDPDEDVNKFVAVAGDADIVVLDDYRIHKDWETVLKRLCPSVKLCVIDDLEREHVADWIVDPGSRGQDSVRNWKLRVPSDCVRLTGPQYAILSDQYQMPATPKAGNRPFSVLISLGGGGDLSICEDIAAALLQVLDGPVRINILAGPLSSKSQDRKDLSSDTKEVKYLYGITEVWPLLQEIDFYIGAAGTMLLQLRCLNIPALTLSLADNQRNELSNMEEIGHYFHLNDWSAEDYPLIASFAAVVSAHYDRIRKMGARPKRPVDGFGSARVAASLMGVNADAPALEQGTKDSVASEDLGGGFVIRHVMDQDVNLYRQSRNLDKNQKFMIQVARIPAASHFAWWFTNSRESFILEKDGKPGLIIWHDRVCVDDRLYMNAGWFVCHEKADFRDVLVAMRWQIDYCARHHHGIPWLSVVRKDNRFARQVDNYFGFQEMDESHPCYKACRKMFPSATPEDWYFIVYQRADKHCCEGAVR